MAKFYTTEFPDILINVSLYFNDMLDYNKEFFEGTAARLASSSSNIYDMDESGVDIIVYDNQGKVVPRDENGQLIWTIDGNVVPRDENGKLLLNRWQWAGQEWESFFTDLALYIQNTSNETRKENWNQNVGKF